MTSVKHRWAWFAPALSIFVIVGMAPADWDPGQPYKMHYPQLPDPEGWDVCLVDQWVADDFECTESGPITDIHFWTSWREDQLGDVPNDAWDISIWDDAGGMPGMLLWQLAPGQGTIATRWYGSGDQGWACPSTSIFQRPDHQEFYQVNITNIQAPWVQEAGTLYWLVIRASIPEWPNPVVGWKTSTNQPPGPIFQAPALWSPDLIGWQPVNTGAAAPEFHDMAFVITNDGGPQDDLDFGDAPEGVLAYPSAGTNGAFPTCMTISPPGWIQHTNFGAFFGPLVDFESDGNGGLCPGFAPYDNDECFQDGDAGLIVPEPFTIVGGVETPCGTFAGTPLGTACQTANWGPDIDIDVTNVMPNQTIGYVNVLIDWDQSGAWNDSALVCPPAGAPAPEHVLVNFPIPNPHAGPLSALLPPSFLIGPDPTGGSGVTGFYVWARFSITEAPVALGWDGSGSFEDGETEDYLLYVKIDDPPPELEPKWDQPPHGPDLGFDAASDYWWQEYGNKWEQLPTPGGVGYHTHDYTLGPDYIRLVRANDWRCAGGRVTDFHWWGSIETLGSGLSGFQISIHKDAGAGACLPMPAPDYQADIPMSQITVTPTTLLDSLGRPIFRYDFDLPPVDWYNQELDQLYWFDLCALSNDPNNACLWVWATTAPILECPSASKTDINGFPGDWVQTDLEFAFRVTSKDLLGQEVNKVVADDFISDGRPIEQIYWAGSYLDQMFLPEDAVEPYIVDGWFISFHHDQVQFPGCPPSLDLGDPHPTVLGIYFAPAAAVTIVPRGYADCNGHAVYDYSVDLSQCCLLCSEIDPRADAVPSIPAQPEAFYETSGFAYWLDIQAVVGVTWDPDIGCTYADRILTGHLPSDAAADGHFWGWHTSDVHNRYQACTGRIYDMVPYPPDCWDYGNWFDQIWQCPPTPDERVDMAFALMAPPCDPMGDVNFDGVLSMADVPCFVDCLLYGYKPGCVCTCADMDGSGTVDGLDIQLWVDALVP
jgi:hypothetical protein